MNDDLPSLLARVQTGDDAALGLLLQHYEPRLRTAARVLLGPLLRPHLDSIDLVQSVHRMLLPALRDGRYALDDPEQLIALALTMLRRKVATNWRRVKNGQDFQSLLGPDDLDPQVPSDHPDDDPARTAQMRDGLEHLLSRLSEADRQLLELRLAGLGSVDIAQKLGVDPHVLRARLSKLRQKLVAAGGPDFV